MGVLAGAGMGLSAGGAWANVELARFEVAAEGASVAVLWETKSERDTAGFYVRRGRAPASGFQRVSPFQPGEGDSLSGAVYRWRDADVRTGETYYYQLEEIGSDSSVKLHDPACATPGGPPCVVGAASPTAPAPTSTLPALAPTSRPSSPGATSPGAPPAATTPAPIGGAPAPGTSAPATGAPVAGGQPTRRTGGDGGGRRADSPAVDRRDPAGPPAELFAGVPPPPTPRPWSARPSGPTNVARAPAGSRISPALGDEASRPAAVPEGDQVARPPDAGAGAPGVPAGDADEPAEADAAASRDGLAPPAGIAAEPGNLAGQPRWAGQGDGGSAGGVAGPAAGGGRSPKSPVLVALLGLAICTVAWRVVRLTRQR